MVMLRREKWLHSTMIQMPSAEISSGKGGKTKRKSGKACNGKAKVDTHPLCLLKYTIHNAHIFLDVGRPLDPDLFPGTSVVHLKIARKQFPGLG